MSAVSKSPTDTDDDGYAGDVEDVGGVGNAEDETTSNIGEERRRRRIQGF